MKGILRQYFLVLFIVPRRGTLNIPKRKEDEK